MDSTERDREKRPVAAKASCISPVSRGMGVVEGQLRKEVGGKSGCVGLMRLVGRNKKIDDIK